MLTEKIYEAAKMAGCETKVAKAKEILAYLSENKTRNVAILGETNSGKTTLINKLCGKEVRPATRISSGEKPLKVVFAPADSDDSYEIVSVDNESYADLTFSEIPFNMAVDYETKMPTEMLEKMDVVIYVVSAVMPMTASDIENIKNLMARLPIMIYISKTDMLDAQEEASEVVDYIKSIAVSIYENGELPIFSAKDNSTAKIINILKDMELEGIREFHGNAVCVAVNQAIVDEFNKRLNDLKEARRRREKEQLAIETEEREEKLAWDNLRLAMLEHCQETIDVVDKKLSTMKISTTQNLKKQFNESSDNKEWLNSEFKARLTDKLENVALAAFEEARQMTTSHSNWFISKVNTDYNTNITVEDLKCYYSTSDIKVAEYSEAPNRQKFYFAVGSGLIAGAAIISRIPLITTCIITIPAALLTVNLVKGGMADNEKYNNNVSAFIAKTCEANFARLTKDIHAAINEFYEKIVESMHCIVLGKAPVSFADLDEAENAINQMLNEIK